MNTIVVAGEMNVDLILTGIDAPPVFGTEMLASGASQVPGSSSMICALGLAKLGDAVRFVGRRGDDERGRFCVAALRDAGIDTDAVITDATQATGLTVALSGAADRALVTFPGAIADLRGADIPDALLRGAAHLHISSYFLQRCLQGDMTDLLVRARAAGLTVSLDPGFDPSGAWDAGLLASLRLVDVFLPNAVEACALAKTDHVEDALRTLAALGPTVVVKHGRDGCLALHGDHVVRVPAFAVAAVDTTGAGDNFNAGFLHAWLDRQPLETCLRWAAACGALSTRALGGTLAQAGVADVHALLDAYP
ncbi:carbohydrate kinase family protein [Luteibacter aegosomatissinici]|uniref:carbohydrate kinase family protein n=1 Tax=Luteibacter aegosomatissinici TaxID=2911539 RepID=UPI001FF7B82E|nr:carbohydrate kinase family protein [Luteibacter aegosomatissinici]UPG96030.1 carbohydrate kinase family protein [Luteibacter aegosomatissinici]